MTAVTAKPKAEHFEHLAYYEVKPEKKPEPYKPIHPYADITKEEVEAAMGLYGVFNVRKVREMH
ncbi:hypothetical protein BH160DRAFT_5307 [Burkholderia sp. H160]|nr:hypothetical protein BH160DRAFT_5307 [Burkholderia sp. H160]